MMNEIQVWQTARLLVNVYGAYAEQQAVMRYNFAQEDGLGARDWEEILAAVIKLRERKRARA